MGFAEKIQVAATVIQAILVAITYWHVRVTQQSLKVSTASQVVVEEKVRSRLSGGSLETDVWSVKNVGPHPIFDVKVRILRNDPLVYPRKLLIAANGPTYLQPGESKHYRVDNGLLCNPTDIYIEWSTLAGVRQRSAFRWHQGSHGPSSDWVEKIEWPTAWARIKELTRRVWRAVRR